MAGKFARVDTDNPRSVCVKLSTVDRANLRVLLAHLAYRPLMPGPISISAAIRFAVHEIAEQCRADLTRRINNA